LKTVQWGINLVDGPGIGLGLDNESSIGSKFVFLLVVVSTILVNWSTIVYGTSSVLLGYSLCHFT
jgi:hypothetical protein